MRKFLTVCKLVMLASCAVSLIGTTQAHAQKKWHLGLGTGFTFMHAQGDQGFNTDMFGPIEAPIDMDPGDFSDFTQSAVGLGGYATNGTWMIQGSFGKVKLGDDPNEGIPPGGGGGTFTSEFFFETVVSEFTVGYTAYRSKDYTFSFTPYAGGRYIKHELVSSLTVTQGAVTIDIREEIDNNWTDFLVGVSFGAVVVPDVTWTGSVDAGFGGSEGSYTFKTGLSIKPSKGFSFAPNFKWSRIEFENGTKGDSDWYFYDAIEFGMGVSAVIHF